MLVAEIMTRKVVTIGADDSVAAAGRLFAKHKFHHVLVKEGGKLVGVISDRDLLRSLSPFAGKAAERLQDAATLKRRVHQIMTRELLTVLPDMDVDEAARIMLEHGVSCLPVVDEAGKAVGICSWRDLLRAVCLT